MDSRRGLSPPTRGSRGRRCAGVDRRRSIPAHTGKPMSRSRRRRRNGVYPRPHGEAGDVVAFSLREPGLSPPTRGSRQEGRDAFHALGSIPAHTGKPWAGSLPAAMEAVYPRPHGEATVVEMTELVLRGLSPPTRGSQPQRPQVRRRLRSIPAHTGKPPSIVCSSLVVGVYPRPHGEASTSVGGVRPIHGLSPPTRGSHFDDADGHARSGSIPAHTGKPRP